jgi:hypothetical protein
LLWCGENFAISICTINSLIPGEFPFGMLNADAVGSCFPFPSSQSHRK